MDRFLCWVLIFAALPALGASQKHCHAVSPAASDEWCNANCNHNPPNCPASLCNCGQPGPSPGPTPRPGPSPPLSGSTFGAYFANWAQYHKAPYTHRASDVAPIAGRVDHIYFGFVYFCPPAGTSPMPYWASAPYGSCSDSTEYQLMTLEPNDGQSIRTLTSMRSGLKVIASIGGWNFPSAYFSKMVANADSRTKFINFAKSFFSQHGFAGIDIDWEFPCSPPREDPVKITCENFRHVSDAGGNCPADTQNFALFMKELRAGLGDDMYISVASQAAEKHWVQMGIQEITPYVDQWHVMTYDYAVPDIANGAPMSPNSPLYTPKTPYAVQMSINYSIQGYLAAGVPASKILLGIPFYGHTWYQPGLGTDAWHQFGLNGSIQGQCCGPFKQTYGAKPGQACSQCGVMMYSEILAALGGSEDKAYHDEDTVSDIAYMDQAGQDGGYTEAGTWITFSGAKSIEAIVAYAKKIGLAGAFVFDTSMDTIAGGSFTYTLMNQIADGLGKPKLSDGEVYV